MGIRIQAQGFGFLLAGASFRQRVGGSSPLPAPTPERGPSLRDFALTLQELAEAGRALESGGRFFRSSRPAVAAFARSATPLGLGAQPTPTTLASFEEVNTIPTSYGPEDPVWVSNSSSSPTLSGIYSGENGDTTLTFFVLAGGRPGSDNIQIEVRDGGGALLDTIETQGDPAGTPYALSNGLSVSFSNGNIRSFDSFAVDVFNSIPESVDPNASFNGAGQSDPNFEPGVTVTSGSFEINGVAIAVQPSNSILDVLDAITNSGAGVTATFDLATEQVVLTQNTPGAGETITVGNDTSGFLAAVKLQGAVAVPGSDDAAGVALDEVALFAGVSAGTFQVNGTSIAVDPTTDTLLTILERLNTSGAGATASYDSVTGRVTIVGDSGQALVLDDVDSGFLGAIAISEGNYERTRPSRPRLADPKAFEQTLTSFVRAFNRVFHDDIRGLGSATVTGLRSALDGAVSDVFKALVEAEGNNLRSGLGVDLVRQGDGTRRLAFDLRELDHAIRNETDDLVRFLFANEAEQGVTGLLASVAERLGNYRGAIEGLLLPEDAIGLRLDRLG